MSSSSSLEAKPTKRNFKGTPKNNDEQIENWLKGLEEDKEFSDVDGFVEDSDNEIENIRELEVSRIVSDSKQASETKEASESEEVAIERNEEEGSDSEDNQPGRRSRIVSDSEQASETDEASDREEEASGREEVVVERNEEEGSDSEDNQPVIQSRRRNDTHFVGKNGFLWSKSEIGRSSRIPAHNIIQVSQPTRPLVFSSFMDLWSKIFDPELVSLIVTYTNQKLSSYRERFRNTDRKELKDTDEIEILSLLGLLYYSSVFKCNGADANNLFATDGTGHEIFRCVMSKYRFCTLINCLRLDNGADRPERLKTDPLAAVSELFRKFVSNSQNNYTPGPSTCIDEMLIPFRGRCKFRIYMPNKPAKYGIKVMILCDAEKYYTYNAYIYCGKNSDGETLTDSEKKLGVPTQSVLRLVKPIENSNRNITADNWFSSIKLVEILRSKKLTYTGTLKKNKREIPPEFQPSKQRVVGSSAYGFTKDFTLLSYVPKKNKSVILISSSHHNASTDNATRKPIMIVDYNHAKGGVDEIDKKVSIYSCSRKTRRWPMVIFYRIVDLAGVNAFVLYESCPGAKLRRGDFLLSLARELVLPSMKLRVYNDRLPRELRLTIKRVLGKDLPPKPEVLPEPGPPVRKLCSICPSKLKRQTRFTCCACKKPICLQCSDQICEDCKF